MKKYTPLHLHTHYSLLDGLSKPEDVAKVVLFLASTDSDFMTGQAINVTGGVYTT